MRIAGHQVAVDPNDRWDRERIGRDYLEVAVVFNLKSQDRVDRPRLIQWLVREGLTLSGQSPLVLWLQGTFDAVGKTFDLSFAFRTVGGERQFRPEQDPFVPDWAFPWIVGIVGLENVARLRPRFRLPQRDDQLANSGQGFFPQDIEAAYAFPSQFDGSGQTLGLLEFSNGYNPSDLAAFWETMNIVPPTVDFVSVDGTPNDGGVSSVDMEATLDVEWAGALAPGARIVVYEASSGTSDQAFGMSVLKALDYAIHDATYDPKVLSISYGDGETRFPQAEMASWDQIMAEGANLGVTTFVASGDEGAYGLSGPGQPIPHVDAPANCPHAMAVGGTHLVLNADGSIAEETGWTDTNNNGASGGGISQVFGVPSYQQGLSLPVKPGDKPGRGVPDVAANADPDTGYAVIFQGSATVVGGTSAASPLWAALTSRINEARSAGQPSPVGFFNPLLYPLGSTDVFHPITEGNNNYQGVIGYQCGPGWNAVCGWGSPNGSALIEQLSASQNE